MEGLSRENIKVGAEFGSFWPERINKIVMAGKNAFLVQTEDVQISSLQHLVVLRISEDGLFRSFIKCDPVSFNGEIYWFNDFEKEQTK